MWLSDPYSHVYVARLLDFASVFYPSKNCFRQFHLFGFPILFLSSVWLAHEHLADMASLSSFYVP
jgi:hypothetical protein